jgi:hypothetical protein
MKRTTALCTLSAVSISAALVLFAGCDEDMGLLIPNNPPGVRLTATPADSATNEYDLEFFWEGWDSDGEVDYFIYAIDPPDMHGSEDSVWTRTDAYSGRFAFEASDYDTLYHWKDPQIAKGWHVFVIKSVDDMGAVSEPDYLAFNAATIAPRSHFETPPPVRGTEQYMGAPQAVGLRVTFRWDGTDADGISTEAPVGYLFKAIDVRGESHWRRLASMVWEDTTEWVEYGANERTVSLQLDDRHNYAIAVRAIDEARAIEPLLLLNANMLWIGARERESFPELKVRSTAFGDRTWRGWTQDTETYEVLHGSLHEFRLVGDASWYGGLITGFSHGWDLDDLDSGETDPRGEGAWTPWSTYRDVITAKFAENRDYFLYIRCKDDGTGVTLATIRFNVVRPPPPKNLCYIDDWRRYPKEGPDGEIVDDQTWQAMLEGYNYGEDWEYVSWDEWDAPRNEEMPSLEFLSRFRVLVWSLNDNRSLAFNQQSAWFQMNYLHTTNVLAAYMTRKIITGERGRVWAFGRGLVESSVLAYLGSACEYPYPVDEDISLDPPCGIRRGSFAMELMHITGEFDDLEPTSGGSRISLFDGIPDRPSRVVVDTEGPAVPGHLYTRPPAAELYPNLPRELQRHPNWWSRSPANTFFEVLEYPKPDQEHQYIFYDPISEQVTGLIPLYRMHAHYGNASRAHDKYCGFRYIPEGPSDPGEIVYFFFPMFLFKDSQIRETAKVVLSDWFGLPDPDASEMGVYDAGRRGAEEESL